jgi:peptidoglycan hydrolase-like protein with peptidoglycan-binding domain
VTRQFLGSRNQIREVQRALFRKGYDAGPEDGSFGPWTVRALRQFQKAQQLPVTEQLDDASLAALRIGQSEAGGEKSIGPEEIPASTSPSTPPAPQETSTPTSPSTPQETSGQRSPGSQPNTLNPKSNAPEEPIAGVGRWRTLWERLRGR